jgi:NADH-quinone oxidoreductase subunit N
MIGIPPLAGFFTKYYVIYDLVAIEDYNLAIFAVLASVIAAFYYLRIIKAMYFDESESSIALPRIKYSIFALLCVSVFFLVGFIMYFAEYFNNLKLLV